MASEEVEKLRALYGETKNGADEHIGIYPENWGAVTLFCLLQTQWREVISPMGHRVLTGIEYAAITPVMKLAGVKKNRRAALFADLRTMELAVLAEMRS